MKPFEQITILGVGLLGGSAGLASRERGAARRVVGFGRRRENLETAKRLGAIDDFSLDLETAVKDADLVILCSPVGSFVSLADRLAPVLKPGCLVTDVGSTKALPVRELEARLPDGVHFVGAHPIAGGEKSGIQAARKDLYNGAQCIVAPSQKTDPEALKRVVEFWECLGLRIQTMDPEEHDYIFGAVSHLPHVAVYALVNSIAQMKTKTNGSVLSYSGAGLRDCARIAGSDPVMWRDIFLVNKKCVLKSLDQFQTALDEIRAGIEKEDGAALEEVIRLANKHYAEIAKNDHRN